MIPALEFDRDGPIDLSLGCDGRYPKEWRRPCGRPPGHADDHGSLVMTYVRYDEPKHPREFANLPGPELGGRLLTREGYEALAESRNTGKPIALMVMGEYHREDGVTFLDLGVTREYIESTTNFRLGPGGFLWTCPDCGRKSGKHSKVCTYE